MNENLPEIKKESLFSKLRNMILKLFPKYSKTEEQIENIGININNEISDFRSSLQAEDNTRILFLQRKLKEKEIQIEDLTDKELDDMIELYKRNIEDKKNRLYKYRKG